MCAAKPQALDSHCPRRSLTFVFPRSRAKTLDSICDQTCWLAKALLSLSLYKPVWHRGSCPIESMLQHQRPACQGSVSAGPSRQLLLTRPCIRPRSRRAAAVAAQAVNRAEFVKLVQQKTEASLACHVWPVMSRMLSENGAATGEIS